MNKASFETAKGATFICVVIITTKPCAFLVRFIHELLKRLAVLRCGINLCLAVHHSPIPSLGECRSSIRGAEAPFCVDHLSRLLIQSQFTQNTSGHTLYVLHVGVQKLTGKRRSKNERGHTHNTLISVVSLMLYQHLHLILNSLALLM